MTAGIYLDYQATTPLAPEALAAMRPWLQQGFANPHSPHAPGRAARAAVEVARDQLNATLGAARGRTIFTSGATEAANIAIQGLMHHAPTGRRKVVTIATEHACVRDTALWLGSHGYECALLPVHADGLVDLDAAAAEIDDRTALVAAMLVNNEIGVIQPIATLSEMARARGARVFCDAVQGFGRVELPLQACDMVALSAHKIHGPKGIGALWLADGVELAPIVHGGAQEGGLRSGTLSPALCAGFGAAAMLMSDTAEADAAHVGALAAFARERLEDWNINGSISNRYAGNLNIRRNGIDAARLISELRRVAFSAGSACASGSGRPSHVLSALGLTDSEARSSIRLGFGRYTSLDELEQATAMIVEAAERQLAFSA